MAFDPTCSELEAIINNFEACWDLARPQVLLFMKKLFEQMTCGSDCDSQPCIGRVKPGVDPTNFIAAAWNTSPPNNSTCPILWVIRGGEVWFVINDPLYWIGPFAGWTQLSGPGISVANAEFQLSTPSGTVIPYAGGYVIRPLLALDYNTGVPGVVLAANTFKLDPGTYVLDARLTTTAQFVLSSTLHSSISQLYNVTLAAVVAPTSNWIQVERETTNFQKPNHTFTHFLRRLITLVNPTTFRFETAFPVGGLDAVSCQRDEILIRQLS